MKNRMRSLWDFDAGGGEVEAAPPVTDDVSEAATSAALHTMQENLGSQIRARLQAGQPAGKIAMYLEQVQPGLGRALLSELQQAARSSQPGTDVRLNGSYNRGASEERGRHFVAFAKKGS